MHSFPRKVSLCEQKKPRNVDACAATSSRGAASPSELRPARMGKNKQKNQLRRKGTNAPESGIDNRKNYFYKPTDPHITSISPFLRSVSHESRPTEQRALLTSPHPLGFLDCIVYTGSQEPSATSSWNNWQMALLRVLPPPCPNSAQTTRRNGFVAPGWSLVVSALSLSLWKPPMFEMSDKSISVLAFIPNLTVTRPFSMSIADFIC